MNILASLGLYKLFAIFNKEKCIIWVAEMNGENPFLIKEGF